MVVDLLCLMVAYVAGSCRGRLTTIFASLLSAAIFAYTVVYALVARNSPNVAVDEMAPKAVEKNNGKLWPKERGKVLMLLAIFMVTITYTAGLSPPGGTWEHAGEGGDHRAGDPVLLEGHHWRFVAFFVFNKVALVASLAVITMLLSTRLGSNGSGLSALNVAVALALLGLMGAYASGSCRETASTVYNLCLVGAVLVYISCLAVIKNASKRRRRSSPSPAAAAVEGEPQPLAHGCCEGTTTTGGSRPAPASQDSEHNTDPIEKARSLILLLATLTATVTYQAGLDPPGGVWRDGDNGHNGGGLILPATHAKRYKVFFYCNSAAFVASTIVIVMVQSRNLISRHALEAAVILDLFGLMGAYAAGSCRDVHTSIYVFVLPAAIVVLVVVIYVMVSKLQSSGKDNGMLKEERRKLEKKRKLLLLLAILAITITYQAGLTPPGGFWIEHTDEEHHYGDSILADNYPLRYKAFFYCNATSFMASVVAIVFLVSRNLSDIAQSYCKALYVCMAAGLVGLMGAYAAGTTRKLRTFIYVFALVGAALVFAALHIRFLHKLLMGCFSSSKKKISRSADRGHKSMGAAVNEHTINHDEVTDEYKEKYKMRKYLMLLGILAASVAYQAGLVPPGSVWPANGEGHVAGNPILNDIDGRRYRVFFYSNSTSFAASVVVIVLLLQETWILPELNDPDRFGPMHMVVVLNLLGLLVAYAAGSCRDWGTSGYVVAMAVMVLAYVVVYVFLSLRDKKGGQEERGSAMSQPSGSDGGGSSTSRPSGSADNV
uniref:PGG domain-containing protein n=1 Tax=Oryza brachyantha TaxID=4533 RepID=J3MDE9_ORYBR